MTLRKLIEWLLKLFILKIGKSLRTCMCAISNMYYIMNEFVPRVHIFTILYHELLSTLIYKCSIVSLCT